MPRFPEPIPPLRSPHVELRLSAERDIPEILIAHQDDPELCRGLGLDRAPSGADLGRRSEGAARRRATGDGIDFTMLTPGSDRCVGQVEVFEVDWDEGRAQASVWTAPALRGRGLAPAALNLTARYLFGACGLVRLELLPEPGNAPLYAAARRAGFTDEGLLRAYLRRGGERIDVTVLSLLPADLLPGGGLATAPGVGA